MSNDRIQRLRARILLDHIRECAGRASLEDTISLELAYGSAISALSSLPGHSSSSESGDSLEEAQEELSISGLTGADLWKFRPQLTSTTDGIDIPSAVSEQLECTALSIADFWWADKGLSREEVKKNMSILPEEISRKNDDLFCIREELTKRRTAVARLVEQLNEGHRNLEAHLIDAIDNLSPVVESKRAASHELLAATIEASLLKLSLLRARAFHSLYGHTAQSRKDPTKSLTMSGALDKARKTLLDKERRQDREEAELDQRIAEYERLVALVDEPGGGFKQIVEDSTRVKEESAECRRDLRRLGWTGD